MTEWSEGQTGCGGARRGSSGLRPDEASGRAGRVGLSPGSGPPEGTAGGLCWESRSGWRQKRAQDPSRCENVPVVGAQVDARAELCQPLCSIYAGYRLSASQFHKQLSLLC